MSVSATNPEIRTATARVTPNSLNSRPTDPVRKASGTNTATSVIVVAMTAKPISLLPSNAARLRLFPISMCRYTFSSTTMASSTTSPIASTSARRVRILIVYPAKYTTASAPMMEIGMASVGMVVARKTLEKGEHHEDHEAHRDDQRFGHFIDGVVDERGRIECDIKRHARRQNRRQVLERSADLRGHIHRAGL